MLETKAIWARGLEVRSIGLYFNLVSPRCAEVFGVQTTVTSPHAAVLSGVRYALYRHTDRVATK